MGSSPGLRFISLRLLAAGPSSLHSHQQLPRGWLCAKQPCVSTSRLPRGTGRKKCLTIRQPTWLATTAAAGAALSGINHHPIFSSPPSEQQNERASLSSRQLRPGHLLLLLLPMAGTSKLLPGPGPSFRFPGNAQKSRTGSALPSKEKI